MSSIRQHTHYPEAFPLSWATGWGEDEFGLWMAFSYKGQRQQFRWCEPGSFLMGSWEDEPERNTKEFKHKVVFSKGFWIADTTVTQSLWEAVMGNNPSRFKSKNRPVEGISWNDTQVFIKTMNRLKPELNLCLPTEAQWEYACRAGSNTSFCWGEQINSELVNFDGEQPYNNGQKSEYRRSTVDVKSFHQNNWGLWQVHGNVYECCQDRFGGYLSGLATDQLVSSIDDSRALRGGSWFNDGGGCRSAHRSWNAPDNRTSRTGFRLAIGY